MLSAYRSKIEKELRLLRYGPDYDRAFQYGFASGLFSAYLHSDAISFPEFQRLTLLKINAWEHNQVMHSQPGQPAQRSPREV